MPGLPAQREQALVRHDRGRQADLALLGLPRAEVPVMGTFFCGHQWRDEKNDVLHQAHVCGETGVRGTDHTHVCAYKKCGATK